MVLRSVCFVAARAPDARPWIFFAISATTTGNSDVSFTMRCTRPKSMAAAMLQFSAVLNSRLELDSPMVRITCGEIVAGMTPSFTSESVQWALLTATTMSQLQIRPTPPPMAEPFMQQIVNCGRLAHSARSRAKPTALDSFPPAPPRYAAVPVMMAPDGFSGSPPSPPPPMAPAAACAAWNVFGSPPAQNMRPLPVSTTMRRSGRLRRMIAESCRPAVIVSFIALLAAGLLSVQYAMPSRTSKRKSSLSHASAEAHLIGFASPICCNSGTSHDLSVPDLSVVNSPPGM
mmetsp:Transcript_113094/g.320376  ORF Transcript_113094/g.320376 Transcript_113094/m.320376 type:complete len:288 (-) Transcript_113094:242-1105(-)